MTKKRSSKAASAAPENASLSLTEATSNDLKTWRAMRDDLYSGVPPEFHEAEMTLMLASDDRAC